jgi:hypothetical protein
MSSRTPTKVAPTPTLPYPVASKRMAMRKWKAPKIYLRSNPSVVTCKRRRATRSGTTRTDGRRRRDSGAQREADAVPRPRAPDEIERPSSLRRSNPSDVEGAGPQPSASQCLVQTRGGAAASHSLRISHPPGAPSIWCTKPGRRSGPRCLL